MRAADTLWWPIARAALRHGAGAAPERVPSVRQSVPRPHPTKPDQTLPSQTPKPCLPKPPNPAFPNPPTPPSQNPKPQPSSKKRCTYAVQVAAARKDLVDHHHQVLGCAHVDQARHRPRHLSGRPRRRSRARRAGVRRHKRQSGSRSEIGRKFAPWLRRNSSLQTCGQHRRQRWRDPRGRR